VPKKNQDALFNPSHFTTHVPLLEKPGGHCISCHTRVTTGLMIAANST
jgi:hypothetical protein